MTAAAAAPDTTALIWGNGGLYMTHRGKPKDVVWIVSYCNYVSVDVGSEVASLRVMKAYSA